MVTGACRSNLWASRLPLRSVRHYESWALNPSLRSPHRPRDASSGCLIPYKTVWFRNSGLQRLARLNRRRAFSTDRSKRISLLGSQSRLGKAKPHGGHCPKDSMSIGSAALAIKPPLATIMRFVSAESFWISRQVRGIVAIAKLASKCATSSMAAGVSTAKTSSSWRPRRRGYKRR